MRCRSFTASVLAALATATPSAAASGLQGSYRATLGARDLVRVGATSHDTVWDVGTWTLTLAGRRWTLRQAGGVYGNAVDRGDLTIDGAVVSFKLTSADGFAHNEFLGTFRWRTTAAGLRFAAIVRPRNVDIVAVLAARPWTRVP